MRPHTEQRGNSGSQKATPELLVSGRGVSEAVENQTGSQERVRAEVGGDGKMGACAVGNA